MIRAALLACAMLSVLIVSGGCSRPAPEGTAPGSPPAFENALEPAENAMTDASAENSEPAPTGEAQESGDAAEGGSGPAQVDEWADYKGAWFDVKYPASFEAIPCERSASADGHDGVAFASPDGQIEFYVFSPQWNGESEWIIQADEEAVVDKSQEKKGSTTVTWVTLSGPGDKYERSYADTVDSAQNTRHIFGFRYPNKAAYERWRPTYLKFKQSLKQYAD